MEGSLYSTRLLWQRVAILLADKVHTLNWLWMTEAKCSLAAVFLVHFNVYLTSYHSIDFYYFPRKLYLWNQLVMTYYVWKATWVIRGEERLMSCWIQAALWKDSIHCLHSQATNTRCKEIFILYQIL